MSHSLNIPAIKSLIFKDWFLSRKYIAMYCAGCLFALSFVSLGEWQFVLGTSLLMCLLVGMSNHQIAILIINERKEQTLPFVMSLPITPTDYAFSKLITSAALFCIPGIMVVLITIAVFKFTPVPDGLIPLSVILCTYFLMAYFITWAVGMSIESEGIIIFVMVSFNCMIGPIFYFMGKTPSLSQHFFQPDAVWNSTAIGILIVQWVVIVITISASFFIQSRKKTFL